MAQFWWLSYVDAERPEGDRFTGACLIPMPVGSAFLDAVDAAYALGCAGTGQVKGTMVTPGPEVPASIVARLMTKEEALALKTKFLSVSTAAGGPTTPPAAAEGSG